MWINIPKCLVPSKYLLYIWQSIKNSPAYPNHQNQLCISQAFQYLFLYNNNADKKLFLFVKRENNIVEDRWMESKWESEIYSVYLTAKAHCDLLWMLVVLIRARPVQRPPPPAPFAYYTSKGKKHIVCFIFYCWLSGGRMFPICWSTMKFLLVLQ